MCSTICETPGRVQICNGNHQSLHRYRRRRALAPMASANDRPLRLDIGIDNRGAALSRCPWWGFQAARTLKNIMSAAASGLPQSTADHRLAGPPHPRRLLHAPQQPPSRRSLRGTALRRRLRRLLRHAAVALGILVPSCGVVMAAWVGRPLAAPPDCVARDQRIAQLVRQDPELRTFLERQRDPLDRACGPSAEVARLVASGRFTTVRHRQTARRPTNPRRVGT